MSNFVFKPLYLLERIDRICEMMGSLCVRQALKALGLSPLQTMDMQVGGVITST